MLPFREPASRSGGASRDRTDDPLLAKQVLSQLSYGPMRQFPVSSFQSPANPELDAGTRKLKMV